MKVFCGIDWSERHHDVALVDQDGTLIAKRRIGESMADFAELLTLLAEAGDSAEEPIPVAIETSLGLMVAALRATNRASPEASAILALAPTPGAGARLSQTSITTALRRARRKHGIDTLSAHIQQTLRIPQLRQPPLVESAMGHQVSALLATLSAE